MPLFTSGLIVGARVSSSTLFVCPVANGIPIEEFLGHEDSKISGSPKTTRSWVCLSSFSLTGTLPKGVHANPTIKLHAFFGYSTASI